LFEKIQQIIKYKKNSSIVKVCLSSSPIPIYIRGFAVLAKVFYGRLPLSRSAKDRDFNEPGLSLLLLDQSGITVLTLFSLQDNVVGIWGCRNILFLPSMTPSLPPVWARKRRTRGP